MLQLPSVNMPIDTDDLYAGEKIAKTPSEMGTNLGEIEDFADEKAGLNPKYDYPKDFKPKSAEEQIAYWEAQGYDGSEARKFAQNIVLVPGAEGLLVRPKVSAAAKRICPEVTDPAEQYSRVSEFFVDKIGEARKLTNYCHGEMGPTRLRETPTKREARLKLEASQQGDLVVDQGQMGKRHAGRSVRRSRFVINRGGNGEYGYGAYEGATMLLTNPGRLVHYDNNLWIDCPGDEYDYDAGGEWSRAPLFYFYDGELRFDAGWAGDADSDYGSVSGFVPQ